jgi:hypothetical protein
MSIQLGFWALGQTKAVKLYSHVFFIDEVNLEAPYGLSVIFRCQCGLSRNCGGDQGEVGPKSVERLMYALPALSSHENNTVIPVNWDTSGQE